MRTVLVGAVESTWIALDVLGRHGAPPAAVCTLPRTHAGRHSDFVDVRPLASKWRVPVIETTDVNSPETLARLRDLGPTYALVIGWSQICGADFLRVPVAGAIGFHPSALPEHRGRAVIPWTILQGRRHTGATLFWLDEGLDSGDILLQQRVPVAPDETAATLYAKHGVALHQMMERAVALLRDGRAPRVPQNHGRATYCAKRDAGDGLIEWRVDARAVWTLIRAVGRPYPGALTYRRARPLIVWEADLVGPAPYVGLPGQVQAILPDGALVQCGDGEHVLLRLVQEEDEDPQPAPLVLRRHEKLGIDWARMLREAALERAP